MRFVGIDPSLSRTGVAIIDNESVELHSVKADAKYSIYRKQRSLVKQIRELLKRNDIVIFEDFGVSARFAPSGRFCERIELLGMLELVCPAATTLPWLSVAPTMLKSFLTGKSSSHKSEVLAEVNSRWGVDASNDDEADAYGLAKFGQAMVLDEEPHRKRKVKFEKYGMNKEHLAILRFSYSSIL